MNELIELFPMNKVHVAIYDQLLKYLNWPASMRKKPPVESTSQKLNKIDNI